MEMNKEIQLYCDRYSKISDSHWEDSELMMMREGLMETLVTPTPETKELLISTRSGKPVKLSLEHGVGWFEIIGKCFKEIAREKKQYPDATFNPLQIKEKFGGLCLYYEAKPQKFKSAIVPFINIARDQCAESCEICGAPGKLTNSGWMQVTCPDHTKPKD
jgi:hypothetical protein